MNEITPVSLPLNLPIPTAPEPLESASPTTNTPPSTNAAALFRQVLSSTPTFATTIGDFRCTSFEHALGEKGIELTPQERTLMMEIFSEFKNQTLDQPLLLLMLSLNRDFHNAQLSPGISVDKATKAGRWQTFFAEKCVDFMNDCRLQTFRSIFTSPSEESITSFATTLKIISAAIEQNFPPAAKDKTVAKIALWQKLLTHPEYFAIATTSFPKEQTVKPSDDYKGAVAPSFESLSSIGAIHRIGTESSEFLSETEMADFLMEYVDWLKCHHKPDTTEGKLLNLIRPKLERMKIFLNTGSFERANTLREEIIGILKQKKFEVIDVIDRTQKQMWSSATKQAAQKLKKLDTQSKPITRLMEFEMILDRLTISLDTLIGKQKLLLTAKRLHSNLDHTRSIPETIESIDCNKSLKKDFLKLHAQLIGSIDPKFAKKATGLVEEDFDATRTPDELQEYCKMSFRKCRQTSEVLVGFEHLYTKYSAITTELHKSGKIEEACALEASYSKLCFSLVPAFFCIQDILSLRKNCLSDEDEIIPEEILDCFDLGSEEETDHIPSTTTTSSDEDSAPGSDSTGSSPIAPQTFSVLQLQVEPPAPLPHPPRVIAPRPVSVSPTSSTDFRFRSGMKKRKIAKQIKEMFNAGQRHGGRHNAFVSEDDQKMLTVVSRSSRAHIPLGTLKAMERQLKKLSTDDS